MLGDCCLRCEVSIMRARLVVGIQLAGCSPHGQLKGLNAQAWWAAGAGACIASCLTVSFSFSCAPPGRGQACVFHRHCHHCRRCSEMEAVQGPSPWWLSKIKVVCLLSLLIFFDIYFQFFLMFFQSWCKKACRKLHKNQLSKGGALAKKSDFQVLISGAHQELQLFQKCVQNSMFQKVRVDLGANLVIKQVKLKFERVRECAFCGMTHCGTTPTHDKTTHHTQHKGKIIHMSQQVDNFSLASDDKLTATETCNITGAKLWLPKEEKRSVCVLQVSQKLQQNRHNSSKDTQKTVVFKLHQQNHDVAWMGHHFWQRQPKHSSSAQDGRIRPVIQPHWRTKRGDARTLSITRESKALAQISPRRNDVCMREPQTWHRMCCHIDVQTWIKHCLKSIAKHPRVTKDWGTVFHRNGTLPELPDTPTPETPVADKSLPEPQQMPSASWMPHMATILQNNNPPWGAQWPMVEERWFTSPSSVDHRSELDRSGIDSRSHSCQEHPVWDPCFMKLAYQWMNQHHCVRTIDQQLRWSNPMNPLDNQDTGTERRQAHHCETFSWSHQPNRWPDKTTWMCASLWTCKTHDGTLWEASCHCSTQCVHWEWWPVMDQTNWSLMWHSEETEFLFFADWKTVPVKTSTQEFCCGTPCVQTAVWENSPTTWTSNCCLATISHKIYFDMFWIQLWVHHWLPAQHCLTFTMSNVNKNIDAEPNGSRNNKPVDDPTAMEEDDDVTVCAKEGQRSMIKFFPELHEENCAVDFQNKILRPDTRSKWRISALL